MTILYRLRCLHRPLQTFGLSAAMAGNAKKIVASKLQKIPIAHAMPSPLREGLRAQPNEPNPLAAARPARITGLRTTATAARAELKPESISGTRGIRRSRSSCSLCAWVVTGSFVVANAVVKSGFLAKYRSTRNHQLDDFGNCFRQSGSGALGSRTACKSSSNLNAGANESRLKPSTLNVSSRV